MKRFQFRFESLLRIRQQMIRIAEVRHLQAQMALRSEREHLEQLQTELNNGALAATKDVSSSANHRTTLAAWTSRIGLRMQTSEKRIEERRREMEAAAAELRRLESDVESLKSLRTRDASKHRTQCLKAVQNELEELILRPWQTNCQTHSGPKHPEE